MTEPLAHIRAHPDLYLPGGSPDPSSLAARVAGDAMALGATRTVTIHHGPWWAVAADVDWLAAAPVPLDQLFRRIVPLPGSGANSMRSEILLTVFANDVLTWSTAAPIAVKGTLEAVPTLRAALF